MGKETWTEERFERMKDLWARGHSASEIARDLGGISRNSVLSKVHRSGLAERKTAVRKTTVRTGAAWRSKRDQHAAAPKPQPRQATAIANVWGSGDGVVDNNAEEPVIPVADRIAIVRRREDGAVEADERLTDRCCRWPIGDPKHADFHFCGKDKVSGLSFCALHARRAYQPPKVARNDAAEGSTVKAKVTA